MATKEYTYRDSKNVEHTISISDSELQLTQFDARLTDTKIKSKPTTFFKDAMKRFAKNKSSHDPIRKEAIVFITSLLCFCNFKIYSLNISCGMN